VSVIENKPYVIDIMNEIQKERERLEKIVHGPGYKNNIRHWGWMEGWLVKPNEDHYKKWFNGEYNVCGNKARYMLKMDFSFCDEYGCGIQICSKCLTKIKKIFKQEVKELATKE
jgi:hypothetical protein